MAGKIKNWLSNNWFKAISAIVLLMMGFSIFYYFFLRPYQNDKPYRECIKQIDPHADFKDVKSLYFNCLNSFR